MSTLHSNNIEIGSMTSTQRDAMSSPPAGTMIYNTTDKIVQHYNGTSWISMSNVFSAQGGTKSTSSRSGYAVHTFTSPGTFEVTGSAGSVEVLIIGGG